MYVWQSINVERERGDLSSRVSSHILVLSGSRGM
jgi:hypothetical protein